MDFNAIAEQAAKVAGLAQDMVAEAGKIDQMARQAATKAASVHADPLVMGLMVFALACFVGYYVVWKVTPSLHAPLMSVTNAISSVIVVGAILAAAPAVAGIGSFFGIIAVFLAAINIVGGFWVTQRMLNMLTKKNTPTVSKASSNASHD